VVHNSPAKPSDCQAISSFKDMVSLSQVPPLTQKFEIASAIEDSKRTMNGFSG
jgi:hypothetical protein